MPLVLKILWNIRNFLLNRPDFLKLCVGVVVVVVVVGVAFFFLLLRFFASQS